MNDNYVQPLEKCTYAHLLTHIHTLTYTPTHTLKLLHTNASAQVRTKTHENVQLSKILSVWHGDL